MVDVKRLIGLINDPNGCAGAEHYCVECVRIMRHYRFNLKDVGFKGSADDLLNDAIESHSRHIRRQQEVGKEIATNHLTRV